MDWITMSLEARNLAYNNVEHVGPENARKKTEGWAAASKTLREQRSQHLDDRFRESCHKRGIHLLFQAPICVRGALRTKD